MRQALIVILVIFFAAASLGMAERPFEELSLPDLAGKQIKLSDHRGKIIFLNFWATRCTYCREEMPAIQSLHDKLKGEKFVVITVALDTRPEVKSFIEEGKFTFMVLLDSKGIAADLYHVTSIPATFVIDKKGKVIDRVIGPRDWAEDSLIRSFKKLARE